MLQRSASATAASDPYQPDESIRICLLVDDDGELVSGEIAEVRGTASKRFLGWQGLTKSLRTWLSEQGQEPKPESADRSSRPN
jgi:hypothetical protein